jgi:hypothetical protein
MTTGNNRVSLGLLADRFAKAWAGENVKNWDRLRDRLDMATGSDLDCQPLDILTDMVADRLRRPNTRGKHRDRLAGDGMD